MVTDGLLEARDAGGSFFTPEEGLCGCWRQGPPTVVDTVARLVHRHAGGVLADDLALMAATVTESPYLPPRAMTPRGPDGTGDSAGDGEGCATPPDPTGPSAEH
jgi:hypothetical protein